jgi:peptide/nickel transport system substrate-binding protein
VIASQLAAVGIVARIEVLEFPVWLDVVFKQHDYDLSLVAHVEPRDLAIFADPEYYFGYDNPRFRDLLTSARPPTSRPPSSCAGRLPRC